MTGIIIGSTTRVGATPTREGEAAFRLAFDANYRDVLAYAMRRAAPADAEDIAAETFTIAWRRWKAAPPDAIRPWLFGIARNVLANRRRSLRRQQRLAARVASLTDRDRPDSDGPDDLEAALAGLPARDREIIYLHCWEDLAPAQIAVVLGCTPNAASIRLHRARQRLAQALTEGGGRP